MNSNFKTKFGHLDQVLPVLFVWFFAGIHENSEFGIGCGEQDGEWGKLYAFCAVHFTFPLI